MLTCISSFCSLPDRPFKLTAMVIFFLRFAVLSVLICVDFHDHHYGQDTKWSGQLPKPPSGDPSHTPHPSILETTKLFFIVICYCSVAKSCLTLWDPVDCSTPGSPVLHHLLEFAQIHCPLHQWCCLTIWSSAARFSFCLQSFPASGSFV